MVGSRPVALREQRGFCEIRDEAPGAGAPESRAAGFRSHHLAREHDALPLEDQHRHHRFLDWRSRRRQQPGAECEKLVGRQLDFELRRLRYARRRLAEELHPGLVRSAAESILLRPALQRRDPRPVQTGGGAGDSVVQAGLHRAGPVRVQGPLARHSQRATGPPTRSGKIAARSAPIISNTFSRTNGRSRT